MAVQLLSSVRMVPWRGVPNMDSPPLFDRLLDAQRGGFFQIRPEGFFQLKRCYRPDSNVLETLITTPDGQARLTESLNSSTAGRLPWSELARRVEALSGRVSFQAHAIFSTRNDTVSPWLQPNPNGCIFHVGSVLEPASLHA